MPNDGFFKCTNTKCNYTTRSLVQDHVKAITCSQCGSKMLKT